MIGIMHFKKLILMVQYIRVILQVLIVMLIKTT